MGSPKVGCGFKFWSLPNTSLPPSGPAPNFSPENPPGFCSKVTPPKPPWALLALPANGKGDFEVDSVFNALSEFFAAENVNVGFASISVGCCWVFKLPEEKLNVGRELVCCVNGVLPIARGLANEGCGALLVFST